MLFDAFYVPQPSVYAALVFFALLYTPLDLVLGIFGLVFSRRNEYAADRFSVETFRRPGAMVSALKKLSVHNLSNLFPHPFYVFLNYSHPPVLQRIEAIRRIEREIDSPVSVAATPGGHGGRPNRPGQEK
jgi:STE24 endopeptidase